MPGNTELSTQQSWKVRQLSILQRLMPRRSSPIPMPNQPTGAYRKEVVAVYYAGRTHRGDYGASPNDLTITVSKVVPLGS